MNIEIDYNPTPSDTYFISVSLSDTEAVSFDYTSKGHRIIKQVLVENKVMPLDQEITDKWDALVINNGTLVRRYSVRWVDMGRKDWVNDEIWETVLDRPVPVHIKDKLLMYSQLISDNYENLDKIKEDFNKFQILITDEVDKFSVS